jgi:hypothetical protein
MAAAAHEAARHAEALRALADVTTDSSSSDGSLFGAFSGTAGGAHADADAAIPTTLAVSRVLELATIRRGRRHGWLKLWLFVLFLSLFVTMLVSWMDIGMLGRQQRTWKETLGALKFCRFFFFFFFFFFLLSHLV